MMNTVFIRAIVTRAIIIIITSVYTLDTLPICNIILYTYVYNVYSNDNIINCRRIFFYSPLLRNNTAATIMLYISLLYYYYTYIYIIIYKTGRIIVLYIRSYRLCFIGN